MTLQQLKYIVAVAEQKSMRRAADALYLSQPSLSNSVRELEGEIGLTLFRRSNRGIELTAEGEEFLSYARQILEQYRLMEARYIERKAFKKKFSVSMQHYTFAVEAFIRLAGKFGMDEYEFAVHETKTFEVVDNVKRQKSLPAAFLSICGKTIPLPAGRKYISRNWRNIPASPLNRGNRIHSILPRKYSAPGNISGSSRRMIGPRS